MSSFVPDIVLCSEVGSGKLQKTLKCKMKVLRVIKLLIAVGVLVILFGIGKSGLL